MTHEKKYDYEIQAGDTLAFEVGTSLIDASNPIDVNWSCRIGLKKKNAATLLVDRAEVTVNADSTKYVVSFTSLETDQAIGDYLVIVRCKNDVMEFQKTVSKTLKITKRMLA